MYNPLVDSIVYSGPKNKPLLLSNGLYRIETIPVGAFVKDNAKSGDEHERIPFEVDLNTLKHWQKTFKDMAFNGIEVPMPLNHTEDPEARRATVVDFEIDKNEKGKDALFTIFKFKNSKAEEDLKHSSVSVFVPPKFVDGTGKEYLYPIRHVCFTDYPVIPGMAKMQPIGLPKNTIAASYSEVDSKKKEKSMPVGENENENKKKPGGEGEGEGEEGNKGAAVTIDDLRQIADKLGLENIPDDKLLVAINHVIDALMEDDEDGGEEVDEDEENEEGNENKGKGGIVAHEIEHKETHYHPPAIAAGFISMGRKSRLAEIEAAAKDGFITPAIREDLIKDYCTDDALKLAFSPEGDICDDFDKTMERIRKNGKVVHLNKEESQNDSLALSYSQVWENKNNNPLMKDAERRAKAAGQS